MTCSLNTYGKVSNLDNIIQFLSKKEEISTQLNDESEVDTNNDGF